MISVRATSGDHLGQSIEIQCITVACGRRGLRRSQAIREDGTNGIPPQSSIMVNMSASDVPSFPRWGVTSGRAGGEAVRRPLLPTSSNGARNGKPLRNTPPRHPPPQATEADGYWHPGARALRLRAWKSRPTSNLAPQAGTQLDWSAACHRFQGMCSGACG
jgi:hypothetical protein